MAIPMPQDVKDKALGLLVSGMSSPQIGHMLGLKDRTIRRWAENAGVANTRAHKKHGEKEKTKALMLYQQGYGTDFIGNVMGINGSLINYWIDKSDKVEIRGLGETKKLQYINGIKKRIPNKPIAVKRPEHARASSKGYVYEHVLVWESVHNRPLPRGWAIHHLNGIKDDNRPENLVAMPEQKHRLVLSMKAQRIRELEEKIKILEKALNDNQLIFKWGDN